MRRRVYPTSLIAAPTASARPDSAERPMRVVTAEDALKIIHEHHALIKNIATVNPSSEPFFAREVRESKNSFAFYVEQMKYPGSFRPIKKLRDGANRKLRANLQTRVWETRQVNETQGEPKLGATHTKKTATSLLPPDGRMHFFEQKYGILLVFDVRRCNVKPDLIFETNIASNGKKWVGIGTDINNQLPFDQLPIPTTLDAIRDSHQKTIESRSTSGNEKNAPAWNEVDCGLSADAVIALGAPENNLSRRLNIQYRQLILRRDLNSDVPLLIITPQKDVYEYTEAMQLQDLANATLFPPESIERDFFNTIVAMKPGIDSRLPQPVPLLQIDIFQAIRNRDIKMIQAVLDQDPSNIKKTHKEKTLIQFAADLEFWDCVEVIANTASTDFLDTARYGSALLHAAKNNQTSAAIALINAGAKVTWSIEPNPVRSFVGGDFSEPYAAIHFSIEKNNLLLLEIFLKKYGAPLANLSFRSEIQGGITPVELALKLKKPEAIALLLNYGAFPYVEAVTFAAEHKKWDSIFISFKLIMSNEVKCSEFIGRLLPIAVLQNNAEAQRKLTGIMAVLTCRAERKLFEENELTARQEINAERLSMFSTFFKSIEGLKTENIKTTEKIVQLMQEIQDHVAILKDTLKSTNRSTVPLFGTMVDAYHASEREKKAAQQFVLEGTLEVLSTQLASGEPLSEIANSKFECLLRNAKGWNDGIGNKTSAFIERAQTLMKMPCAKRSNAAISAVASADQLSAVA